MKLSYKSCILIFTLALAASVFAQSVVTLTPYNGNLEQTELFNQIIADTTANGGMPADRVYELQGGQVYLCTQIFRPLQENHVRLVSSNDQHAIIYLYQTGTGDNPQNPPGYFIRTKGGDVTMDGIALVGYFEPIDSNFFNMQGGMLRSDNEGSSFYINNCIFSGIGGQILRTNASTVTVKFTDCIMTNLGNLATSNLGAGKGIDLRDVSCDSLILVNNTFTNYQDRVVRHYNFGDPTAGTGLANYVLIDHNTFYNGMGFHGTLSLGNVGEQVTITNNLFVDAFAAGEDSTDATRTAEFANNGEFYPNGNNRMAWIFTGPNETTNWDVARNYYAISNSGQAFFDAHTDEPITKGSPLTWHINSKLGADSVTAFVQIPDPGFAEVQDLMTGIMNYYVDIAGKTKDTPNSYWRPEVDDMDRKPISYWMNDFDVSYSTSSPAYTGAYNGFPAGNLNAYPDQKAVWETTTGVEESSIIVPVEYSLNQNFPNPFNPSTVIRFSIPETSNVTLKIYDVLGNEVSTLVNDNFNAGQYDISFNASRLASGVYFYTINAGSFTQTRKMMLLK